MRIFHYFSCRQQQTERQSLLGFSLPELANSDTFNFLRFFLHTDKRSGHSGTFVFSVRNMGTLCRCQRGVDVWIVGSIRIHAALMNCNFGNCLTRPRPPRQTIPMPSNSPINPSSPSSDTRISRNPFPDVTMRQNVSPTPPAYCVPIPSKATTKVSTGKVSKQRYTPAPRGASSSSNNSSATTTLGGSTDSTSIATRVRAPKSKVRRVGSKGGREGGREGGRAHTYVPHPVDF